MLVQELKLRYPGQLVVFSELLGLLYDLLHVTVDLSFEHLVFFDLVLALFAFSGRLELDSREFLLQEDLVGKTLA